MCTVSFIPLTNSDYRLISNRDVPVSKTPALFPIKKYISNKVVLIPEDPDSGGSWIATSGDRTLCLLNGAFESYIPYKKYPVSRGTIIPSCFKFDDVKSFIENFDFTPLESFTLVWIETNHFYEIRWNEKSIHFQEINRYKPTIYSSATLYSPEMAKQREAWFHSFLMHQTQPSFEDHMHFHKTAGIGDATTDVLMKREFGMQTVSITAVEKNKSNTNMYYEDVVVGKNTFVYLIPEYQK